MQTKLVIEYLEEEGRGGRSRKETTEHRTQNTEHRIQNTEQINENLAFN